MDLSGKVFVIDPGHGGKFPGAKYKGNVEEEITLKFSKALREVLRAENAESVKMTRINDRDFGGTKIEDDLNKRVKDINRRYADDSVDILISIHVNTNNPFNRKGVFYPENGKASKVLAQNIQRKYATFHPAAGAWAEDLAILRDTKIAGAKVLIELGQIDDFWYDDPDQVERAATAIVAGIYDYFREIE
ncbi:N-acetylmuramoyl-L-alanine amidase [Brevibacillus brevis]|uniref:N-acetylmuramoyl-L-alanine amidase n=1 Tax=Brevibacillus brevis TaxID=1393 RepID=A0A517I144_BREBE|nr:N-acetylmuramoyl-L-alanine amidase [Brevibacillus brevis]QDS32546.1 N-acetylmuramoyl-L-alanine amidase [Brevibacillus brevis]